MAIIRFSDLLGDILQACEAGKRLNDFDIKTLRKCVDRLAHYEDLEEQGRLVKLPCRAGDVVYRVYTRSWVGEDKVMSFVVLDKNHIAYEDDKERMTSCALFGKTVFLTRPEAEAALAASGKEG